MNFYENFKNCIYIFDVRIFHKNISKCGHFSTLLHTQQAHTSIDEPVHFSKVFQLFLCVVPSLFLPLYHHFLQSLFIEYLLFGYRVSWTDPLCLSTSLIIPISLFFFSTLWKFILNVHARHYFDSIMKIYLRIF